MNRQQKLKSIFTRAVFASVLVLSACLTAPFAALSKAQEDLEVNPSKIKENLHLLQLEKNNALLFESESGLVLVDAGDSSQSEILMEYLNDNYSGAEVSVVFNTHWHLNQTGSNVLLASQGSDIIAHENTKLWMGTEIISKWNDVIYPARSAAALPTSTFYYGAKSMVIDQTEIRYGYLPQAHTDGDIYIYFPRENVIAGGGVVTGGEFPVFDYSSSGWVGGMINSLRILLEISDADTVFVPASGELRNRTDLEAQLELCEMVIRAISTSYYSGESYAEFIESMPLQELTSNNWSGDVDLFLQTAHESAWGHVTELRRYR